MQVRDSRSIAEKFCEDTIGGDSEIIRTEPYNPDSFICTVEGGDAYDTEDVIFALDDTGFWCGGAAEDV